MRKLVKAGNVTFGDGHIYIQSMLNVPAADISGNIRQAQALESAGCEVIRVSVPEATDSRLIFALKNAVHVPVVADIHFDYRIALEAVAAGADKIRINPGNIGDFSRVKEVAASAKNAGVPIRVGVNSGSIDKDILREFGFTGEALAESALRNIAALEQCGFGDIVVSVKSSDVAMTIHAYRRLYEACPYPLHIGVTEAGTQRIGVLKSAACFGALFADGIGDTLRVSLTADPLREVSAARDILSAMGVGGGYEVISCPTCGRTEIGLIALAGEVEKRLAALPVPEKRVKVAVMGCAVNGPGEAAHADFGIAGGKKEALLFGKGAVIKKVNEDSVVDELIGLITDYAAV